jgi:hypothetical protein
VLHEGEKMTTKLLPAALFAAMLATPAMACTDWKAVAAFDAVIAANNAATRVEDIKFIDSMGTAKIADINQNTLNEHRELDNRSRAAVQEHLAAATPARRTPDDLNKMPSCWRRRDETMKTNCFAKPLLVGIVNPYNGQSVAVRLRRLQFL